jgi:co-chaperonin GroES (HSP10)
VLEDPRPIPFTLEPLDDFLVIELTDEESETRGGLILPASVAETQCQSGIVTAVGAEAEGVAPGDKVLFLKEAGYEVRLAGLRTKVVRRHELIARIHD